MNSLGSWIDKSELERLVAAVGPKSERTAQQVPASQKVPHMPNFTWHRPADPGRHQPAAGDDSAAPAAPERFPVAEEVEKFRNKVAAIKDKARSLGVLSPGHPIPEEERPTQMPRIKIGSEFAKGAPTTKSFPSFRAPQGPLRLRLECFGEWAATVSRAEAVIVADSQGDLVFERGADPAWVSSVSVVASAGERAGRHLAISGNTLIHLDLPDDRKLAVLPCQTKFGQLSVGLVVTSPLRPEIALAISDAIGAVVARN